MLWKGAGTKPMWRLDDTKSLVLLDMWMKPSTSSDTLDVGIELTNGSASTVTPRFNIMRGLQIEAGSGVLNTGVHYKQGGGGDANNDHSAIYDSRIDEVTEEAILIGHSQSLGHLFVDVNGSGVDESGQSAAFVRNVHGSFESIGGMRSNFDEADYVIEAFFAPISIRDSTSERSSRLLLFDEAWNAWSYPLIVQGGRFAVDEMDSDGEIIKFTRRGPLTVEGLNIDSTSSFDIDTDGKPVISYSPTGSSWLRVVNVSVTVPESDTYDFIKIGSNATVFSAGNMCLTDANYSVPCDGFAAGMMYGTTFDALPSSGTIPNGHWNYCIDCEPTDPCTKSTSQTPPGAIAVRRASKWDCNQF
jgi:hypothetical protein